MRQYFLVIQRRTYLNLCISDITEITVYLLLAGFAWGNKMIVNYQLGLKPDRARKKMLGKELQKSE